MVSSRIGDHLRTFSVVGGQLLFPRFCAISFEVLAILFAAYSEGFPLVAQLSIAQARALPFFRMPGLLSGGFSFGQGSAAHSSSVS